MSDTRRGIIRYTSRDYQSILDDFRKMCASMTELWKPGNTDSSEDLWRPEADADPGVVLAKFLASAADMIGTNTDWFANELFAPSVSQRKNAEKIFGLIGYTLGFYTAARTEVTFTNVSGQSQRLNFGFNGANFATLNAYTDITKQSRVITYNILPLTNKFGYQESRSRRAVLTSSIDVFATSDEVVLAPAGQPGSSVTRVAIEGELRSVNVAVEDIKRNNYIINLPSQHIDTTAVWIKGKTATGQDDGRQWVQVASPADFITPEPRFAVTYDNYSNAQIQISNYLDSLEDYSKNILTVYWIDCSGVIGCVNSDVLTNLQLARTNENGSTFEFESGDISISNLSNTVELPNTFAITGRSPETAKEAYYNSRNYINTFDSLVTLPDYTRFLNREPGVDCGLVIDCQKALDINLSIYNDTSLSDADKAKKYITKYDFPAGQASYDWQGVLNLGFDPNDPQKFVFSTNFKPYTAMCFAVSNDFQNSDWGNSQISLAQISKQTKFTRYKPPVQFIEAVKRDYRPLQAMSVEIDFGYLRLFNWKAVMQVYTKQPVSVDVGETIVSKIREALSLYFAPANRSIGQLPSYAELNSVATSADSRIAFVDLGSPGTSAYGLQWIGCDPSYFNPISFARYVSSSGSDEIRIASECIVSR